MNARIALATVLLAAGSTLVPSTAQPAPPAAWIERFEVTSRNRLRHGPDEVRIITRGIRIRAEVAHRVALAKQHGLDHLFVGEPGVIGSDGNGKRARHDGSWDEKPGETRDS